MNLTRALNSVPVSAVAAAVFGAMIVIFGEEAARVGRGGDDVVVVGIVGVSGHVAGETTEAARG